VKSDINVDNQHSYTLTTDILCLKYCLILTTRKLNNMSDRLEGNVN
jgi:hypothetical protein